MKLKSRIEIIRWRLLRLSKRDVQMNVLSGILQKEERNMMLYLIFCLVCRFLFKKGNLVKKSYIRNFLGQVNSGGQLL